jgi:hypothetical protein
MNIPFCKPLFLLFFFELELICEFARLSLAMALKHGYTNVEDYKNGVQKKFSLLELGILEKPSTRLLLINVSFSTTSLRFFATGEV